MNVYEHSFWESGILEQFGHMIPAQALCQECSQVQSEGLRRAGEIASKMAPSTAVGGKPQLLAVWTSSPGCLSGLTVPQLTSPRVSNQGRERRKPHMPFYEPTLEVTWSLQPQSVC